MMKNGRRCLDMHDKSNQAWSLCELCCKLMHTDDEIVKIDLDSEQLASTGSKRAHRHCLALSVSLGSLTEARRLLAPRTGRPGSTRTDDIAGQAQPLARRESRTITIRPARMTINTIHTGSLFNPQQRTANLA
jgi:hypothetical protein